MNSKIVVLAGDGIGPEIMDSGLQNLRMDYLDTHFRKMNTFI